LRLMWFCVCCVFHHRLPTTPGGQHLAWGVALTGPPLVHPAPGGAPEPLLRLECSSARHLGCDGCTFALTACLGVGACACVGCGVPCLHVWCGVYASPEAHSVRVREVIWREPHVTKMKKKSSCPCCLCRQATVPGLSSVCCWGPRPGSCWCFGTGCAIQQGCVCHAAACSASCTGDAAS